ncbi:hypothetical protein ACQJBY_026636 [Aegilops geniculata]
MYVSYRNFQFDESFAIQLEKVCSVLSRTENHDYHRCWTKKLEQLCFYFHALWFSILGRIEFTYSICLNSEGLLL